MGGTAHTEGKKEFAATDQDQVCVKKIQVVSKRRDASAGVGNAVCVYNSASLQQCQIFQVLTLSSVTSKNKCCCYYCVGLCCGCGIILSFIMMTLFAAAALLVSPILLAAICPKSKWFFLKNFLA